MGVPRLFWTHFVLMTNSQEHLAYGSLTLEVGSKLASFGPTVVLMTNSEEHLVVPRSISSSGRLGTTADAMRPLISVSAADGAPAKRASESESLQLPSSRCWMRCHSFNHYMSSNPQTRCIAAAILWQPSILHYRHGPPPNNSSEHILRKTPGKIMLTTLQRGILGMIFAKTLCREPWLKPLLFLVHIPFYTSITHL